jgi:hypothetical protein
MRAVVIAGCLGVFMQAVALGQEETYTTRRGYVACADKASTTKALGLSNDYNARGADAFVADRANHCEFLKAGATVYLVSKADNLVEIRPDGATTTVWTVREALSRQASPAH